MTRIRAIIIDDEANARAALRGIIEENIQMIEIVDETKNIPDGVKAIYKLKPDLVFLDIEMPGYSGLDILDFFNEGEVNFKIVFVTANNQHALDAFKLSAIDYIVKPVQLESIQRAINKLSPSSFSNIHALSTRQKIKTELK